MALSMGHSDVDQEHQAGDVVWWSGARWRVVAVGGRFLDIERCQDRGALSTAGDELTIDIALLD